MNSLRARLAALLFSVALWFVAGCLMGPVPMRTRARTGPGAEERSLDLSFLKVGSTTRREVVEKLDWMRGSFSCPRGRVFSGRWQSSSWGFAGEGISPGGPVAGSNRKWKYRNLLIQFNENGVVERYLTMSDKEAPEKRPGWLKDTGESSLYCASN